jgi:hypothetical protein
METKEKGEGGRVKDEVKPTTLFFSLFTLHTSFSGEFGT